MNRKRFSTIWVAMVVLFVLIFCSMKIVFFPHEDSSHGPGVGTGEGKGEPGSQEVGGRVRARRSSRSKCDHQ